MSIIVGMVAMIVGGIVGILKVLVGLLFLSMMGLPLLVLLAGLFVYWLASLVRKGGG